jgi:RNA polymerase sigma-70 factor (ECF subfamily)
MDQLDLDAFERARPTLLGLAYRILGSRAEAEDVVQDCFVKWQEVDRRAIDKPAAWLSTACTRRCLDLVRAPHRARVDYVGPWLPEPIQNVTPPGADEGLAASLTTAFLLVLERLTPKERAAYLLHEIFDLPYPDVAAALEQDEAACRQLVSRARAHLSQNKVRHQTPAATQDRLLDAFQTAIRQGTPTELLRYLSLDVRLTTDSGGKAAAALRVLEGAEVLDFLNRARTWWDGYVWTISDLNAGRGAILTKDGQPVLTLSFGFDESGHINDIFIMRNPDKLGHLGPIFIQ